ncbi:MAG: hypothetical protein ACQEW0_01535 [Pseudomonadota bacterium]
MGDSSVSLRLLERQTKTPPTHRFSWRQEKRDQGRHCPAASGNAGQPPLAADRLTITNECLVSNKQTHGQTQCMTFFLLYFHYVEKK